MSPVEALRSLPRELFIAIAGVVGGALIVGLFVLLWDGNADEARQDAAIAYVREGMDRIERMVGDLDAELSDDIDVINEKITLLLMQRARVDATQTNGG